MIYRLHRLHIYHMKIDAAKELKFSSATAVPEAQNKRQ